jgi:hypothetical protein
MMNIPVSCYGLHTDEDGIVYLHQGRNATNFIGLKKPSPFEVAVPKKKACPHLISHAAPVPDHRHWAMFQRMLPDPLVQALLPVPKEYLSLIPYLNDANNELAMSLAILTRMASPIYPVVHPVRKLTKGQVIDELSITNVCPLVLTGVQTSDNSYINELAREARTLPRRLLFTGDPSVVIREPLQRIQSNIWTMDELDMVGLPLETLGALLLRRFARGERLDANIVRGNQT